MARKVSVSEFEQVIMDALEEYRDDAREAIAQTLPLVGKETVNDFQDTSPKQTGDYAKGWKYQMDDRVRSKDKTKMIVFNRTHYYLTHLLEYGHETRNGGRSKAKEHIKPAAEKAENKALERIKQKLEALR